MEMSMKTIQMMFVACLLFVVPFYAERAIAQTDGNPVYIDTAVGNTLYRRTQTVNGNRVESIIRNDGTFGMPGTEFKSVSGVWPIGSGHGHVDQMSLMVGAQVTDRNGGTVHIISESYSGNSSYIDQNQSTGKQYAWNPLPGYFNPNRKAQDLRTLRWDSTNSAQIASSTDPTTWPRTWPGKDATWDGTWNGYFGKNQFNADQEVAYVIDDSYNSEFAFYPFTNDTARRGLGLQVETRLFQWSHPLAEDQIFVHFQITNVGDNTDFTRNLAPIYLGAFADTHPGGSGDADDMSSFNRSQNMVFSWDYDDGNVSQWQKYQVIKPGYVGWKYLESPGIGKDKDGFGGDGVDNDNDGLVDESRDNDAGSWVFGPVGNYAAPKWHWSGDEDGDWVQATDDVGTDGLGPLDPNYRGPDADGTEGNGRPDQGEPNFGKTDNDESDQIGLTSFSSPQYGSNPIPQNDESMWSFIENSSAHPGVFQTPAQNSNNVWIFASGPFDLNRMHTERFSVCWLFGETQIQIMRNAKTSQQIYDNDYRFTTPPIAPRVKAVAGDKKVTLYWDDLAESSRDPIYGQDFEGYKIFRGTNPQLSESQTITDAYGTATYRQPVAQFDLNDGIKGLHPIALGAEWGEEYSTGSHYNLGNDSGLRHYYVDNNVTNGVTYYYVVISYDKGYYTGMDDRGLVQVSPAESPGGFKLNSGVVTDISRNAAVVMPNATSTNYVSGTVDNSLISHTTGSATGSMSVQVIDPDLLPENHAFEVTFDTTPGVDAKIAVPFATNYTVRDVTSGEMLIDKHPLALLPAQKDTEAVKPFEWQKYDTVWTSTVFQGMVLNFRNSWPDTMATRMASGWQPGSITTGVVTTNYSDGQNTYVYPVSFRIIFDSLAIGKSFSTKVSNPTSTFNTYFTILNSATGDTIPFYFKETLLGAKGKWDKTGEGIYIGYRKTDGTYTWPWYLSLTLFNPATDLPPQPGDVYNFVSPRPFTTEDKFTFNSKASKVTRTMSSAILDKVAVVPNPYLTSAIWERETSLTGRGERMIQFIHLPQECTIRIFTQNGVPIKTITHSRGIADGTESWDLTTSEGLEVAFGIYVYYIEANNIGHKIGTFAIIN
jgi:hypothetical protein